MRVHEETEKPKDGPPAKSLGVNHEEAERASMLYVKQLDYLHSLTSDIPQDPPTEEEMKFLADFLDRLTHQRGGGLMDLLNLHL